MKELQEILKKLTQLAPVEKAILATVVDVQGSSYRLPGAKMLILKSGETFGTISGGCLEADVLERAKKVWRTNEAQIFLYDTTAVEDSVFSLNMGCRGVIWILLAPVEDEFLDLLKRNFAERQNTVTAVVVETGDAKNFPIGKRFYIAADGKVLNAAENDSTKQIAAAGFDVLKNERSSLQKFKAENGAVELFFDFIAPPLNLLLFGAGADAVPLCEIAKNLGWRISIIDHRAAYTTAERFPAADEIFHLRSENLTGNLTIDNETVAVVMTHNFERDGETLRFLLSSNARYVGALGPKRRTENILQRLKDAGETFDAAQLAKLYAPVGLDIGADTPEAIALSIIAEIQAVLFEKRGGFLRDKHGSIYDRN